MLDKTAPSKFQHGIYRHKLKQCKLLKPFSNAGTWNQRVKSE